MKDLKYFADTFPKSGTHRYLEARSGRNTQTSSIIPEDAKEIIEAIFQKSPKVSIIGTGSGGSLFAWLLGVPGCSTTILSAEIPYSMSATNELLETSGINPEVSGFCSSEVAVALAKKAHSRAAQLQMQEGCRSSEVGTINCILELGSHCIVGLGFSASVVSSTPKRGPHRCHIATYTTEKGVVYYNLELHKGTRSRFEEDQVVSRLALRALANATSVEIPQDFISEGLLVEEGLESVPVATHLESIDALEQLYSGFVSCVLQVPVKKPDGTVGARRIADVRSFPTGTLIYPGSYNPLHKGHIELLKRAQLEISNSTAESAPPIVFEIAAFNADKPPIAKEALEDRLKQFVSGSVDESWNVVVTKVPLFIEKARLFPNCSFVIGADTLTRLIDPKYYSNDELEMVNALSEIQVLGCKFVVGGRKIEQNFVTLEDILSRTNLPLKIKDMFIGITEESFRADVSSSEIRAEHLKNAERKNTSETTTL